MGLYSECGARAAVWHSDERLLLPDKVCMATDGMIFGQSGTHEHDDWTTLGQRGSSDNQRCERIART